MPSGRTLAQAYVPTYRWLAGGVARVDANVWARPITQRVKSTAHVEEKNMHMEMGLILHGRTVYSRLRYINIRPSDSKLSCDYGGRPRTFSPIDRQRPPWRLEFTLELMVSLT